MKSTEVYKEINKTIFPKLKSYGFKKTKSGMLGFYKKIKDYNLVIWFQCSQEGFDPYAGSKFIVEIQLGQSNEIGTSFDRNRIPHFLTRSELDNIVKIENEIKNRLQKPPQNHFIFSLEDSIQRWYMRKFEKEDKIYSNISDIWFIYYDSNDIQKWMEIIEPVFDRIVSKFENVDN